MPSTADGATLRRSFSAGSHDDSGSDLNSDRYLDPSAPRVIKLLPRRLSHDRSSHRVSTPAHANPTIHNSRFGAADPSSRKTSDSEDVPEIDSFSLRSVSSDGSPPTSLSPHAFDKDSYDAGQGEEIDASSFRSRASDGAFHFTLPPSLRQAHSWDPLKAAPILISAMLGDDETNELTMAQLKIASQKCTATLTDEEAAAGVAPSQSGMSEDIGRHSGGAIANEEGMSDTDDGYDDMDQPWFEPHGNNKKRKSARSLPSRAGAIPAKTYVGLTDGVPNGYGDRAHPDEDDDDYLDDMPVRYLIARARLPLSKQASAALRHRVRMRYARVRAAKALAQEEEVQKAAKAAKAAEEKEKKIPKRLSKAERRAVVRGGAGGKAPPKTTLAAIRARTAQNSNASATEAPDAIAGVAITDEKLEVAALLLPSRSQVPTCRFTFTCSSPISAQLARMRLEIDRFQIRVCEAVDSSSDARTVATRALASINPQGNFAMPVAGVAMIATARLVATRQKTKVDPSAFVDLLLKAEGMSVHEPSSLEEDVVASAAAAHARRSIMPSSSPSTLAKSLPKSPRTDKKADLTLAPPPAVHPAMPHSVGSKKSSIAPQSSTTPAIAPVIQSSSTPPAIMPALAAPDLTPPAPASATSPVAQSPVQGQASPPPPPPKMSRRRKANMNNVHHRANYVPSRVPSSSANGGMAHKATSSDAANSVMPGMDHPTTSCSLFPDEWLCLFCEYELFYGEPPLLVRAARRRKKLVANRRRAQERAHKAAEGVASTKDNEEGGDGEEGAGGKKVRKKKKGVERCTCGKAIHDQKRPALTETQQAHRHTASIEPAPLPAMTDSKMAGASLTRTDRHGSAPDIASLPGGISNKETSLTETRDQAMKAAHGDAK